MSKPENRRGRREFISGSLGYGATAAISAGLIAASSKESSAQIASNNVSALVNLDDLRDASSSIITVGLVYVQCHGIAGDGGHGTFRYVSGQAAGDFEDNNGTVIVPTGGNGSAAWLRLYSGPVSVRWFGAVGDSQTDDRPAIQGAIDAAIATTAGLILDDGSGDNTEYRITGKLTIDGNLSITGSNPNNVTLLCVGTSGLEFSPGAIRCTLSGFGIAAAVRHTSVANSYAAITFLGTNSSRPYWNTIENLFIDGFYSSILMEWAWDATIRNVKSINCGRSIRATGITVNNYVYGNSFIGNDIQIELGDSTNTVEGWHIYNNFFDGGRPFWSRGASYCKLDNNVMDHIDRESAILIQSASGLPSLGFSIMNNYIAFSGNGHEGIRLLNNISTSTKHGHVVSDNTVFSYATGSLLRGILIDGSQEHNNIVKHNKVTASVEDCKISGATGTLVTGNMWLGAGFYSDTQTIYTDNVGIVK